MVMETEFHVNLSSVATEPNHCMHPTPNHIFFKRIRRWLFTHTFPWRG
jgi:hypothetical protein